MVNRFQLYSRVTKDKGFVQYLRIPGRSPSHWQGICAGASKVWLSYFFHSGSDHAFWAKYGAWRVAGDDYEAMYNAHDDPRNHNLAMKLRVLPDVSASTPTDPRLSAVLHGKRLKFCNIAFKKPGAHAMAAYTPGGNTGHLFDPNFGQFDVGPGHHYTTWDALWQDIWDYYDLRSADIFAPDMQRIWELDIDTAVY